MPNAESHRRTSELTAFILGQDCVANSSGATAIGRCACRTSNVQEATTCGDCFGGEDATNAKGELGASS